MLTIMVNTLPKVIRVEYMRSTNESSHRSYMESLGLPVIDMEIMYAIHNIKKISEAKAVKDLSRHKLSIPQIDVLVNLMIFGFQTSTELADRLNVTKANLTGMIKRLEDKELLTRKVSSTDGRSKTIELTRKGRSLMNKVIPDHFKNMSAIMSAIPDEEKISLVTNLELILNAIREEKNY